MFQIIPNWHPIFVHFTVALFSVSVIFFVLAYLASHTQWKSRKLFSEFEAVGRWCLWVAALTTIATLSAGFYDYYSVKHDVVSHAAMTVHRNWALGTATAIFLMAFWSVWRYVKQKELTLTFVITLLIVQGLLVITALHGGELVYRHGIGVMSLPQAEEIGHQHSQKIISVPEKTPSPTPSPETDKHSH